MKSKRIGSTMMSLQLLVSMGVLVVATNASDQGAPPPPGKAPDTPSDTKEEVDDVDDLDFARLTERKGADDSWDPAVSSQCRKQGKTLTDGCHTVPGCIFERSYDENSKELVAKQIAEECEKMTYERTACTYTHQGTIDMSGSWSTELWTGYYKCSMCLGDRQKPTVDVTEGAPPSYKDISHLFYAGTAQCTRYSRHINPWVVQVRLFGSTIGIGALISSKHVIMYTGFPSVIKNPGLSIVLDSKDIKVSKKEWQKPNKFPVILTLSNEVEYSTPASISDTYESKLGNGQKVIVEGWAKGNTPRRLADQVIVLVDGDNLEVQSEWASDGETPALASVLLEDGSVKVVGFFMGSYGDTTQLFEQVSPASKKWMKEKVPTYSEPEPYQAPDPAPKPPKEDPYP